MKKLTKGENRLGLGAAVPVDGGFGADGARRKGEMSSSARLRKVLLGKDRARIQGRAGALGRDAEDHQRLAKARPLASVKRRVNEDSEEEECGGRSSLGRSKRTISNMKDGSGGGGVEGEEGRESGRSGSDRKDSPSGQGSGQGSGRKTAGNYLDQVLAEKSQRKRNKKRRKETARVES